jgi:dephospho-CoA kinase
MIPTPHLVAFAGFSGAGKTTAIQHLEVLGVGQRIYLGEIVLAEISARGLSRTPELELQVRVELRDTHGPAVFVARATPLIQSALFGGTNAFIDAIFQIEEYQHLQRLFQGFRIILLAIETAFEIRSERLKLRSGRSLSSKELRDRDGTELVSFKTNEVINGADYRITNEESLPAFNLRVENFWSNIANS